MKQKLSLSTAIAQILGATTARVVSGFAYAAGVIAALKLFY